jgi:hypothetical protein
MLTSCLLAGVLLAFFGVTGSGAFGSQVWAQSEEKVQLGPPLEGQITYMGLTHIEVEKKSYNLHPKVSITTENGQPFELKQLQPGQGVQFWLKEGAMYQIIAILPR